MGVRFVSAPAGQSSCATNAVLDPAGLADNGGPTETTALGGGSPAIDAGNDAVCDAQPVDRLDQRGFARPDLGATHCSIGVYECNSSGDVFRRLRGGGAGHDRRLLPMVNIALGNANVSTCPLGDASRGGQITIAHLLAAVNNALAGCLSIG